MNSMGSCSLTFFLSVWPQAYGWVYGVGILEGGKEEKAGN